jgi:p70 ribosomal S6 kinase
VATALEHMHNKGYVYRDLKPENILLHAHGSVQLADFGMAKKLAPGKRTNTVCGTAQYMSPEVLLHRGCSFEADLWAMGIFIYELTTGDTPFSSNSGSRQELYRRLMSHDPEQMTMANSVDRTTAAVVKGLLQNVESQRLGAGGNWAELYRQQWFHCVDVGAVQRGEVVPDLSPRRRNVINDPRLQQVLEQGDVPWQRGNIVEDPAVLALFENF